MCICVNASSASDTHVYVGEGIRNGSKFRLPTMDAHNGLAPDLNAIVETDHILSISALGADYGNRVHYTSRIPNGVRPLMPRQVHGTELRGRHRNGDMYVSVDVARSNQYPAITRVNRGTSFGQVSQLMHGWG